MLPAAHTWSLTAIAAISGVALLWIWKRFSNQERIGFAKRQMRARLYAMRLYGDEPALALRAQGQLLVWTSRYLAGTLAPAALSMVPILTLFVMLDNIYGHRPLRAGEAAMVTAQFGGAEPRALDATLEGRGAAVETAGVRLPDRRQVCWRVRVVTGEAVVLLHWEGHAISEAINCGYGPGIPRLPWERRPWLEVACPDATPDVFGFSVEWRLWFVLVSLLTMLALRGRFHVTL